MENRSPHRKPVSESYREYQPARALRPFVACYWTSTAPAHPHPVCRRILPDGCIDIIVDLSQDCLPRATIVGTMTRPFLFQTDGPIRMVAVRFRPGGAVPFFRFAADEFTDSQLNLSDVWRGDPLVERIQENPGSERKIQQLESALLARLPSAVELDRRVQEAVSLLRRPGSSIERAAATVGLSRQHLARLFRRHVGVGPKQFGRVVRMQRLLSLLRGTTGLDWPAAALDAGYYDQAHMITECRSLTGLTPTQLAGR